jgi:nitroimidazol reductase NimA-like FMN-containing flavoprotein (pyridoxamine 5'-phosphate oxidase superfamily)
LPGRPIVDSEAVLVDQGLELLTEEECRDLLASEQVGRVGITIGALPAIFPVNYRMIGGEVVFRTGEGLKRRAALRGTVVGFEVDRVDPATRTGWSVLVVGVAEEFEPAQDGENVYWDISPWAEGERSHFIRIRTDVVSGRRIIPRG